MKKPYFNQEQRDSIRHETMQGAFLFFHLKKEMLIRDVRKQYGCIMAFIIRRKINNIKLS